jgi:hypothetical protein
VRPATALCLAAFCWPANAGCEGENVTGAAYEIVCDDETGLCWQDPQRNAAVIGDTGLISQEALRYCDELVLGGFDDWRLPSIDELRSIIAGAPNTEPGGVCGVIAGADLSAAQDPTCFGEPRGEGPNVDGCYLQLGLTGPCDRPDPATENHALETWALDAAADSPERWLSFVSFDLGAVGFNHVCSLAEVRCVRDGSEGLATPTSPDNTFSIDPLRTAACDLDLCEGADRLDVTIGLPEALTTTPFQLMAFLYTADGWTFPPIRPPDGGTSYDQVVMPDISVDRPAALTVPGCTYYREELLAGDYQLFVQLLMHDDFPPLARAGDYWWGEAEAPFAFPFDGSAHAAATMNVDITLEPWTASSICSTATPFDCGDGSCALDPTGCVAMCDPAPSDADIFTCRYGNTFEPDNCGDFPVAAGWATMTDVEAFCAGQPEVDVPTVRVTRADSCQLERGQFAAAERCVVNAGMGRTWYSYDTPAGICTAILGGAAETGPFCDL